MEFTGERFVPGVCGDIELAHLPRYLQAGELAAGTVVLDIASGEGYGTAMLAANARKAIGIDLSSAAVAHARERYRKGAAQCKACLQKSPRSGGRRHCGMAFAQCGPAQGGRPCVHSKQRFREAPGTLFPQSRFRR